MNTPNTPRRELDQHVAPALAWIRHVMKQEQRAVLVACESIAGCDRMAEALSDIGSVTVVLGYMNGEAIEHVLAEHQQDGKPTIVVGTIQRIGHGVAFKWPTAYVTSSASLRIEEQIQLMARPRTALNDKKVLAYFHESRPSNGWLTVADYVDYTIGGNLKDFGFDEMLDKSFEYDPSQD